MNGMILNENNVQSKLASVILLHWTFTIIIKTCFYNLKIMIIMKFECLRKKIR